MEATRPRMDAKMSGQVMSAMITASTITTHDVISGRFWPSTCFQQKEMVSFAEAVGNSESSATRGFLFERVPGVRGCAAPCRSPHRVYGLNRERDIKDVSGSGKPRTG